MTTTWTPGPPPTADDGSPVLVMINGMSLPEDCEYYAMPIVVSRWASKLKTTIDAIRLEYDDVLRWAPVPEGWQP